MRDFHSTQNEGDEISHCIQNFHYYSNDEKNIIPFESSIQDIFDILVSMSINHFGLKDTIEVKLYEDDHKRFDYIIDSFNNCNTPFLLQRTTGVIHIMPEAILYSVCEYYQKDCLHETAFYSYDHCQGSSNIRQLICLFTLQTSSITSKLKNYEPSKKRSKRQQSICTGR